MITDPAALQAIANRLADVYRRLWGLPPVFVHAEPALREAYWRATLTDRTTIHAILMRDDLAEVARIRIEEVYDQGLVPDSARPYVARYAYSLAGVEGSERRETLRFDCSPHHAHLATAPHHLHRLSGTRDVVEESPGTLDFVFGEFARALAKR